MTLFTSSLPPAVCRITHVIFTLSVLSNNILLCFCFVSLDCQILIVPSIFSKAYYILLFGKGLNISNVLLHNELYNITMFLLHYELDYITMFLLHYELYNIKMFLLHYELYNITMFLLHYELYNITMFLLHYELYNNTMFYYIMSFITSQCFITL